jgi:hypothetical protein
MAAASSADAVAVEAGAATAAPRGRMNNRDRNRQAYLARKTTLTEDEANELQNLRSSMRRYSTRQIAQQTLTEVKTTGKDVRDLKKVLMSDAPLDDLAHPEEERLLRLRKVTTDGRLKVIAKINKDKRASEKASAKEATKAAKAAKKVSPSSSSSAVNAVKPGTWPC